MKAFLIWCRRIAVILWSCFVLFVGAWISFENTDDMKLTLFSFDMPVMPEGIYVALIFLVGILAGLCSYWIASRGKIFDLKRQKNKLEKELHRLRTSPISEHSASIL